MNLWGPERGSIGPVGTRKGLHRGNHGRWDPKGARLYAQGGPERGCPVLMTTLTWEVGPERGSPPCTGATRKGPPCAHDYTHTRIANLLLLDLNKVAGKDPRGDALHVMDISLILLASVVG